MDADAQGVLAALGLGAAIGKLATSGTVGKALIEPTLSPLGRLANAWGEHWLARFHPKQRENVKRHAIKAVEVLGEEAFIQVLGEPSIVDWGEGVSRVGPDDDELARIWLAALASLHAGGRRRQALLSVAKQMNADEAEAFERLVVSRHRPGKGFPVPPAPLSTWLRDTFTAGPRRQKRLEEQAHHERFVQLGLTQSLPVRLLASGGLKLAGSFTVILGITWWIVERIWGTVGDQPYQVTMGMLGFGCIVSASGAALLLVQKVINQPEFTRLGDELGTCIIDLRARSVGR
ncbi:hypothetical protein PMI01_04593 [Caulobacter sp. AP07]|uniref:hypothetical protein n=1 Tax=Caulobacter sp. AP07 TaxID=1144304 RepID=UPI00027220BB|nr:hypothetical protein [Caulobacter sp. AP07]EJL24715.1 hypothetical protein PMI01_04593 [Caulobacter sp. AP07]